MLARSYTTALPFAEDLASKGFKLVARPSTLMSELLTLSTPVEFEREVPMRGVGDYNSEINMYGGMLGYHTEGESGAMWGASFDDAVDRVAKSLNAQISYIRNVVQPRVKEFAKDAQAFIEGIGKHNPASDLEIRRNVLPELVTDSAFLTILDPHRQKAIAKPGSSTLNFPFKEVPADLFEVATLSNSRLDGLVKQWAAQCDFNYMQSVWFSFFAGGQAQNGFRGPYISQDELNSPDLHVRLNTALAYFLFANYYMNHKPDGDIKESAASLDRRLFEHQRYAGALVSDTLERILSAHKSNMLVTNVDTFHKKISVYGEVYDKWLSAGGSSETILGLLVGTQRYFSVELIDKNAEALKKAWANYVRIHVSGVEFKKADTMKQFYLDLIRKYLSNDYIEELEQSFILQRPHHHEYITRDAEAYLKGLKKEELLNTWAVSVRLVAGLKYGDFTEAENFMNEMANATAGMTDADAEEAAAVATIFYVVDYIQGQLGLIKG